MHNYTNLNSFDLGSWKKYKQKPCLPQILAIFKVFYNNLSFIQYKCLNILDILFEFKFKTSIILNFYLKTVMIYQTGNRTNI